MTAGKTVKTVDLSEPTLNTQLKLGVNESGRDPTPYRIFIGRGLGHRFASGGYEELVPLLTGQLEVDGFDRFADSFGAV